MAQLRQCTVATLPPAASNVRQVYRILDSLTAGDCVIGGGTKKTIAVSNGTTWESMQTPADATDISLGNCNNTTDANKPISTAQQTALNLKVNTASLATVATSGSYADLSNKPTIPGVIAHFNASGAISAPTKKWIATVTPSTTSGYSIDISSAGFISILNYQIIAIRNTGTVTSAPNVSIKSVTTTAIVVNIVEGQASQITLLGSVVPLGLPIVFANTSGLTLQVMVEGT